MDTKDILFERVNHRVGEIIKAPKLVRGDTLQQVEAVILEIYPFHCVVQDKVDPKYRWSVMWVDLMGVK